MVRIFRIRAEDASRTGRGAGRALRPALTTLEDRRLLTIGTIVATVTPHILEPVGRFVPVTVSGTIQQGISATVPGNPATKPGPSVLAPLDAANANAAAPGKAMVQVVDQYRADEPTVLVPLTQISTANYYIPRTKITPRVYSPAAEDLVRTFSFSTTLYLQAKLGANSHGRQYVIFVSATDQNGPGGKDLFAFVPHLGGRPVHARRTVAARRK